MKAVIIALLLSGCATFGHKKVVLYQSETDNISVKRVYKGTGLVYERRF